MSETTSQSAPEPKQAHTLSQAAAALGMSEKTLRKRIHAGEVEGEKVSLEGGGVAWTVYLHSSAPEVVPEAERNFTATRAGSSKHRNGSAPEGESTAPEPKTTVPEAERQNAPEVTVTRAGSAPEGDFIAHLQSENTFLRGLIEQRDRDAAELRAVMREMSKAMPKALAARDDTSTHVAARNEPQAAELGRTTETTQGREKAPESGTAREARPLWKLILGMR
jgi:hypothetical protein